MNTIRAEEIRVGDVIRPPEREMRLWMRRQIAAGHTAATELDLTVTEVREAAPDKNGPWLLVIAHAPGRHVGQWKIKVRPATPWPVVRRVV